MTTTPNGGPAFPMSGDPNVDFDRGLSKREYFAGRVMPQILADMHRCVELGVAGYSEDWRQHAAAEAVKLADALLAELARTEGGGA